jgi:hypothetical protein
MQRAIQSGRTKSPQESDGSFLRAPPRGARQPQCLGPRMRRCGPRLAFMATYRGAKGSPRLKKTKSPTLIRGATSTRRGINSIQLRAVVGHRARHYLAHSRRSDQSSRCCAEQNWKMHSLRGQPGGRGVILGRSGDLTSAATVGEHYLFPRRE